MRYKRVIVSRSGGPEVLQVIEDYVPEPGPGEARVKILAAGVSYADLLMREGVHPEAQRPPFTPGWDMVGVVDKVGEGISTVEVGQMVAALPVRGGYAEFICLPQEELVPVPSELDAAEAVSMVLNYVTAYQMIHRSASDKSGQRTLIHAAAGGIGTALLQLGQLIGLEMYGTAPMRKQAMVSKMGCIPIDYEHCDYVKELLRLTGDGVDVVFDGIGGFHLWRSLKTLRAGGKVVAYGLTSTLRDGRLSGWRRSRLRGLGSIGFCSIATFFLPGKKRMLLYSIQRLKRRRPVWFQEDLSTLLGLLCERKIKPIIAERIPLIEARRAHELLGKGSVSGKIVLLCEDSQ